MYNSMGDIDHGSSVQKLDSGDMHVSGKIDGSSFVYLVTTGGSITVDDKIDGNSYVVLISTTGSITIGNRIDGSSQVTLKAAGNITIGDRIDGSSQVDAVAGGNIEVKGRVDGSSTATLKAAGDVTIDDKIDGSSQVDALAGGNVEIKGRVDGSSRVVLVGNRGSAKIDSKIDGSSSVSLTAGGDIGIGLGGGDRNIDGNSFVSAVAGGKIDLGGGIKKDHTSVDFAAVGNIDVGNDISNNATVRVFSSTGKITVSGGISDSGTHVTSFPKGAIVATISGGATLNEVDWTGPNDLSPGAPTTGYWWRNWPQTFGYVAPFRVVPHSVDEISLAVLGNPFVKDDTPVKAIGSGWSFTDAVLPFQSQGEVSQASILLRGAWQRQDMRNVLDGLGDDYPAPMDLLTQAVGRNSMFSAAYDQATLRQGTSSGAQLPASKSVRLIDMRSLASSLQCEFPAIRADTAHSQEILFHVEAGITMADLQQLLDHQHPRLALRATGSSAGATLAGAVSTATHGGEFRFPLLIDSVRAVHLVGPGGEQWWIEGNVPVADQTKLQARFPAIDAAHFIGAGFNGIPGLTGQDVLDAVVVSMGTMGVIYSVVLAVVPQFGIQQIVHPTNWQDLLGAANVTENQLRARDPGANQTVLKFLMDGNANGTGIGSADNIYIDLAINPINQDCWIVNRRVTPKLPDDANNPPTGVSDYATALSRALSSVAQDTVTDSKLIGRVFDFLSWATDVPVNVIDLINEVRDAGRLISFLTRMNDILSGTLAISNVQAVANAINASSHPDRGLRFLGDVLSALIHALEGTSLGVNSDRTDVSHRVGAVGWPDSGVPGRALEVALDSIDAFTFLQTVLLDDVLTTAAAENKPLIGYVSIRVCPHTGTLLGMQQFRSSVMIEVVAYRSPEADTVMDRIQEKAKGFTSLSGQAPLLHWGLENDKVDSAYLAGTPLGGPFKGGFTRLSAFKAIRKFFKKAHPPVFDNFFTARTGL